MQLYNIIQFIPLYMIKTADRVNKQNQLAKLF